MKLGLIIGAMLIGVSAPASAMTVATFLTKAEALKKKGPLALFSGDLKLLMNQVKADAAVIRKERLALKAAGKPASHCPPEAGVKLNEDDVIGAMKAVPGPMRAKTSTKQAMEAYLGRRFPC